MIWLALLPVSLLVTLLAYLLAPVLPLFAISRDREMWLPKWLWWFQTPDNSLWGDEGHRHRHPIAIYANYGVPTLGYKAYWPQVIWLWRNPAYGFEWDGPLAAKVDSTMKLVLIGNPNIKNRTNAIAGWYFCRVGPYWNFKLIKPGYVGVWAFYILLALAVSAPFALLINWLAFPITLAAAAVIGGFNPRDTAFMLELGWKLQGFAQGRETEGKAMYVFSPRLTTFYR